MYRVLLAEDNPGDVLLFREALHASGVSCELLVVEDGAKALQFLEQDGAPGTISPLDLIVLDVNLPKRSGQDVLRWVRSDPGWGKVPVMILTSSSSPDDRKKATELGADLYVQKSSSLDEALKIGTIVETLLKESKR